MRCPVNRTPSFVKTAHTSGNGDRARDVWPTGRLTGAAPLFYILPHSILTINDNIPPYWIGIRCFTPPDTKPDRRPPRRLARVAVTGRGQVPVNRHKVTMLHHLLGCTDSRLAQEPTMAEPVPDTPGKQTACWNEKTFTRRLADTLRSHPSCISARAIPLTNGAADVSGR